MKTVSSFALAGAVVLGLAPVAQAQTYLGPQIPTPANPNPLNPVATNGTPLPSRFFNDGPVLTGRSAYVAGPVGVVGAGVGAAGAVVDTSLGAVGTVVNGVLPR